MTIIVAIEGNIGSGKTTLLQELATQTYEKPHSVVFEQVSEWTSFQNSQGENILELFYKDQTKYSYIFQSYVLFSRIEHILKAVRENPNGVVICERCHLTDLMVFAKSLFELKHLTEMEWIVYQRWHQMIRELFQIQITAVIYNRASPEICLHRINKRNRSGESSIPLEYLELIHSKHDDWLMTDMLEKTHVTSILLVDGNQDNTNEQERRRQLETIIQFINEL